MKSYDYEDSGFDGFLSRSVDNLPQVNLDSRGPQSTAQAYDRSQVSGFLGDTFQVGGTKISRDNIIMNDGDTDVLLIGKGRKGEEVVKMAQPGYDVNTTGDENLIWSSAFNSFKIVKILTPTHTIGGTDLALDYFTLSFAHTLGFIPAIIGGLSNTADGAIRPMPLEWRTSTSYSGGGNTASAAVYIDRVDTTFIYVNLYTFDIYGLSWLAANNKLSFKFYCLRETIL